MAGETGTPTILVIDDEKNIRRAIEIALAEDGMQVLTAHDAKSGLRALSGQIVDALILDIRLNDEIDGLALFRKMQTDGLTTPVIFISGAATLTEAARAVKMGAFDFVEKPFTPERISVAVQRCLEFSQLRERVRLMEVREVAASRSWAIRPAFAKCSPMRYAWPRRMPTCSLRARVARARNCSPT